MYAYVPMDIYPLVRPFMFINLFIFYSFIHSFICSSIYSFSVIHRFFIHFSIHSFVQSFHQSAVSLLINSIILSLCISFYISVSFNKVERGRTTIIQQSVRQLNSQFGRRGPRSRPMTIHRVKVSFKDEPGEGSGVARSFYTALSEALLSGEKLPSMDLNRGEFGCNIMGSFSAYPLARKTSSYNSMYGMLLCSSFEVLYLSFVFVSFFSSFF